MGDRHVRCDGVGVDCAVAAVLDRASGQYSAFPHVDDGVLIFHRDVGRGSLKGQVAAFTYGYFVQNGAFLGGDVAGGGHDGIKQGSSVEDQHFDFGIDDKPGGGDSIWNHELFFIFIGRHGRYPFYSKSSYFVQQGMILFFRAEAFRGVLFRLPQGPPPEDSPPQALIL